MGIYCGERVQTFHHKLGDCTVTFVHPLHCHFTPPCLGEYRGRGYRLCTATCCRHITLNVIII